MAVSKVTGPPGNRTIITTTEVVRGGSYTVTHDGYVALQIETNTGDGRLAEMAINGIAVFGAGTSSGRLTMKSLFQVVKGDVITGRNLGGNEKYYVVEYA